MKIRIITGFIFLIGIQNSFCQTDGAYSKAITPENDLIDLYSQTLFFFLASDTSSKEQYYLSLLDEMNKNGQIAVQIESGTYLNSLSKNIGKFKIEYFYGTDHSKYRQITKHSKYFMSIGIAYFNIDSIGIKVDFIAGNKTNSSLNRSSLIKFEFDEQENVWKRINQ